MTETTYSTNRISRAAALCLLFALAACGGGASFSSRHASGHYGPDIVQCAPYARKESGVNLYGNAYSWWDQAATRYRRGSTPAEGAVLVLKRTKRMSNGHVAVVKELINPREIDVKHSNWGSDGASRRIIYESMRVEDVSPANDWTLVRFWNREADVMGRPYAAYGFIYP